MQRKNGFTGLREHLAREGVVELSLGCQDIQKMDLFSLSDPFCIVYVRNAGDWEKVGTTETFNDTYSCKWAWKLFLDELFASSELKFEVYDRDSNRDILKDHDFIGYVQGKLIGSMLSQGNDHQKIELLRSDAKKTPGYLLLTLDWIDKPLTNYDMIFEVSVDCQPRRNLYYHVMRKCCYTSQYVLVLRSNVLDKKSCRFKDSVVTLMQFGSTSRQLRIELFEAPQLRKSRALGFIPTSLDELLGARLNTPLTWTACEKSGLQNPRISVTHDKDTSGPAKRFFIHISD